MVKIRLSLGAIIFALLLVVALVLFTIFSAQFRLFAVSLILLILGIFLLVVGRSSKGNGLTIAGVVLVLVGVGFVLSLGLLQAQFGGSSFVQIPVFATLKCEQIGSSAEVNFGIATNGEWLSDRFPENTINWNIKLINPDEGRFSVPREFEYYICNSRDFNSCRIHQVVDVDNRGGVINIGELSSNDHFWAQYQKTRLFGGNEADSGAFAQVIYAPFQLTITDPFRGGTQLASNDIGCTIPSSDISWRKRITNFVGSSDVETQEESEVTCSALEGFGGRMMCPGQSFNYVTTNVVSVLDGNTQNGGYCIFANGNANVYEIEEITLGDGTRLNRVNTNNLLRTDECCQSQALPTGQICENGNLIEIEESECTRNSQCGSLEFNPVLGTSDLVQRAQCVQNQCTFEQREVECTIDAVCSTNQVCSRNTFTCIDAGVGGSGEPREEEDENECRFFETFVTETETVGTGPLGAGALFGSTKEIETSQCKVSQLYLIIVMGIIIIILAIIAFMLLRKPKGGKK